MNTEYSAFLSCERLHGSIILGLKGTFDFFKVARTRFDYFYRAGVFRVSSALRPNCTRTHTFTLRDLRSQMFVREHLVLCATREVGLHM